MEYYLDENNEEKIKVDTSKTLTGYANDTTITKIIVGTNCTSIGKYAFSGCTSLTKIVAETTNTMTVNEGAFSSCSNLETFKATNFAFNGGTTFASCTNLENLELGSKEHLLSGGGSWPITNCTNPKLVVKLYIEENVSLGHFEKQSNATIIAYNSNGEQIN